MMISPLIYTPITCLTYFESLEELIIVNTIMLVETNATIHIHANCLSNVWYALNYTKRIY